MARREEARVRTVDEVIDDLTVQVARLKQQLGEERRRTKHLRTRHAQLKDIIAAYQANPYPVHYKVREAIKAAQEAYFDED